MILVNLLLMVLVPLGFLIGLGDILYVQAQKRGRHGWLWMVAGCSLAVCAGVLGYLLAPLVVEELAPQGAKARRLFVLSVWLPAVAMAGAVGALLQLLGPVARRSKGLHAPVQTFKAEEWHTGEVCKRCGFLLEVREVICQCPACGGFLHVRCWNDQGGCPECLRASGA